MDQVKRSYLELHFSVLLFGLTAILGDLIQLSAPVLVWWRVLITSLSFIFIVNISGMFARVGKRDMLRFMGIGVIVALHWICFYGSIKLANASIAVLCMATASFFTSVIEPFLLRKKFVWLDFAFGLMILPGMVLIVNNTRLDMLPGFWVGLLAAALAALFATLNKKYIHTARPLQISLLEMSSAWLFITLLSPVILSLDSTGPVMPTGRDWIYLLVLSLLCTTLPYALSVRALQHVTAFASNMVINLEPVYGVILAWLILGDHEDLNESFYLGTAMIIAVVFLYPIFRKRFVKKRTASVI